MIEGLKLTLSGEELRKLLDTRIQEHQQCADRWERDAKRTEEEQTEDDPQLPEHVCTNEAKRHTWRADVMEFSRDHVRATETYRLGAADLEFAELMPQAPGWVTQEEYEERNRTGLSLERMALLAPSSTPTNTR